MSTPIPEKEPSMEDILRTIRGVIAGKEDTPDISSASTTDPDDILELTEVIEEDGSVHTLKEKKQEGDILDDIDKATIRDVPPMSAPLIHDTSSLPSPDVPDPITSEIPPLKEPEKPMSLAAEDPNFLSILENAPPLVDINETKNNEKTAPLLEKEEEKIAPPPKADTHEMHSTTDTIHKKSLISEESAASSMEALQNLVNTIPKTRDHGPQMRAGTTLEDLVIEALKPPLSQWLEVHLSSIVKQLVEKEIKRLMPKDE